MKKYLIHILLLVFASNAFAQSCPDTPDLSSLEVLCDYEDPYNLEEAAGSIDGEWSVAPLGGNVFVYLGWLYYQGASAGDYTIRLDVTNPSPNCPAVYEFDMQLVTTALVWPIPQPVCPGDSFLVGDIALSEEGFHEVYLPADICDSLVQVILFHDDSVCEDDSIDAQGNNEDGIGEDNLGVDVGATVGENGGVEPKPEGGQAQVEGEGEEEEPENNPTNNGGGLDLPGWESSDLIYPTAFSPDLNGINDTFGLINTELDLTFYSLRIFDRWGGEVFVTELPYERWNGICRGKAVSNGVYTFTAHARTASGEELWQSGPVTLIR